MNDRYLYRAKRTDNGEWVVGHYVYYPDGMSNTEDTKHTIRDTTVNPNKLYFINQNTICQCTGLKDKNGKMIWENDIIKGKYYSDYRDESDDDKRLVLWDDDKSAFCPFYWFNGTSFDISTYEIIGNSFDNPELLEASNG